ncbi:MAG: sigma-70 family RNA polymerase sigma factor [Nannocystaceae bacterium]
MSTHADLELLAAWRGGDDGAGEALFDRHFESIYRFFCNKVGRDVDDLVQQTFLGCLEARERLRGDASFRTFLFAVARNQLLRHREGRYGGRPGPTFQDSRVADLEATPTQLVVEHEEQALLLRALRRLPLDLQIALELFYWESLPSAALAEVLEIPHGTVRSRLRRGREQLRIEVERLTDDPALANSTLGDFERWMGSVKRKAGLPSEGPATEGEPG